jgi:hypothetical protein
MLLCPQCGYSYKIEDTTTEENFEPKFDSKNKTRIITAKKKKKYYDQQGNLITDETLIQDVARGATIYRYHEQKVEGDSKKPRRHIVRK